MWARRFGGDRTIVGRRVPIDGRQVEIIGVMPSTFHFPDETTEIWKPMLFDADAVSANNRGSHGFTILARLKPGITIAQAKTDLDSVAATFRARFPDNYRNGFSTTLRFNY